MWPIQNQMSSAAGLTSYSSLFAAGLDPTGRMPPINPTGYMYNHGSFADFSYGVNTRNTSADTRSSSSRRSSLPTFVSFPIDHRYDGGGGNGSFYTTTRSSAQGISFAPSVLIRSDTTATKRSNLKSFLSLDANDTFLNSPPPPIPSNASRDPSSSRQLPPATKPPQAASKSNPTWALPALPSPCVICII